MTTECFVVVWFSGSPFLKACSFHGLIQDVKCRPYKILSVHTSSKAAKRQAKKYAEATKGVLFADDYEIIENS